MLKAEDTTVTKLVVATAETLSGDRITITHLEHSPHMVRVIGQSACGRAVEIMMPTSAIEALECAARRFNAEVKP